MTPCECRGENIHYCALHAAAPDLKIALQEAQTLLKFVAFSTLTRGTEQVPQLSYYQGESLKLVQAMISNALAKSETPEKRKDNGGESPKEEQ